MLPSLSCSTNNLKVSGSGEIRDKLQFLVQGYLDKEELIGTRLSAVQDIVDCRLIVELFRGDTK
jgi:hypothetical protein